MPSNLTKRNVEEAVHNHVMRYTHMGEPSPPAEHKKAALAKAVVERVLDLSGIGNPETCVIYNHADLILLVDRVAAMEYDMQVAIKTEAAHLSEETKRLAAQTEDDYDEVAERIMSTCAEQYGIIPNSPKYRMLRWNLRYGIKSTVQQSYPTGSFMQELKPPTTEFMQTVGQHILPTLVKFAENDPLINFDPGKGLEDQADEVRELFEDKARELICRGLEPAYADQAMIVITLSRSLFAAFAKTELPKEFFCKKESV